MSSPIPSLGSQPAGPRRAGSLSTRPPELTIPAMFFHTAHHFQDKVALLYKEGGKWLPITYHEFEEQVVHLALSLTQLGVSHGDRVALISENRPEWAIVDLAVVSIGAVNTPLYTTLPPVQAEYIIADSQASVVIVSNDKQLAKVMEVRERLPLVKHIVVVDPPAELPAGVTLFSDLLKLGAGHPFAEFDARRSAVKPSDLASIIYTSGTTGAPKGAMLTHDNFMSNAQAAAEACRINSTDLFLSFLPLSHSFERIAGHYFPLLMGATIAYAESIFTVQGNMVEIKPTIMASVPRLYESMESRIKDQLARRPEAERKKAEKAFEIGWEYHSQRITGEKPGLLTQLKYWMVDEVALKSMRARITGGQLRYFISGGAPLPVETAKFLTSLGLNILEGYGLTETSPVICVNTPQKRKLGTVGPPIPGVEVRIADDGEILSRGPHIMQGYFNLPDATAQAINADGWFHTGDIGVLDDEGYLKITDRKKDIIVLANGKNVAPQQIEALMKSSSFIGSIVLFGDRQPNLVALIVPDFEHLKSWARQNGLSGKEPDELVREHRVKRFYKEELERLSSSLADFERIRKFALLTRDFSIERGELTPTLKIKRKVVAENFSGELDGLLGGKD